MNECDEYLIHVNNNKDLTHTYFSIDNPVSKQQQSAHIDFNLEEYKKLYQPLEDISIGEIYDNGTYDSLAARLGKYLFGVMFPGELNGFFHDSIDKSKKDARDGLRFRICVNRTDLSNVNWEYLYDNELSRYLSTYTQTPFTRFHGNQNENPQDTLLSLLKDNGRREKKPKARTLFVTSNPTGSRNLDPEVEIGNMLTALKDFSKQNIFQHEIDASELDRANWNKIRNMIDGKEHFDIVHFYCHGTFRGGRVNLIMADENRNEPVFIPPDSFGQLFDGPGANSVSLVYINACKSALTSRDNPQGLVQNMVTGNPHNIPAG
jgi:hypothetical protein